jgi:alpha-galactosidase
MPIHAEPQGWVLETDKMAYAFGVNGAGLLTHRYWGPRLPLASDYPPPVDPKEWASFNGPAHLTPEEYPGYESIKYTEPCLNLVFADGVRGTVARFAGFEVREGEPPELRLTLRDDTYALELTLIYRLHERYDLIERSAVIHNQGDGAVTLERAWSAQWHLPPGDTYRLSHLVGQYFTEMQLLREPLAQGVKRLESRRIATGHSHNPWFAVDAGRAGEDSGEVWFGALAWSGNWVIAAEVTGFQSTRVSVGLNDWDFAWQLGPGESFATPSSFGGYSDAGFGGASRLLHDFIRDTVLPHGRQPHKVLYNSWEVTFFDVNEATQGEIAEMAAAMGVELFVMDDGWFHGRTSDRAGLGDWWPDERKFPQGLTPLIERVNGLGMEFGLWVEPEMVNPDSELYRAHPEWAIHYPTRPRSEGRNQLMLNLGRVDVQNYLIDQLDRLLANHKITFIKWDMNRNVSEPGWPDAPGSQRELWVRYVEGLYRVWGTLRERHPQVIWQSCSGGGGRADLGILRFADQIWLSDNTNPLWRIGMQEGFSQLFPASTMEAWVTDMGPESLPLEFRFHVSMCGVLGIGGHLGHWGAERRAEAAELIALYKAIRPLVQDGDLYRLQSAVEGPFSALQYVSKDRSEAVLFAFRTHMRAMSNQPYFAARLPTIYLRGLDPEALYAVEGFPEPRSGQAWMRAGLYLHLEDFQSTVRRVRRIEG